MVSYEISAAVQKPITLNLFKICSAIPVGGQAHVLIINFLYCTSSREVAVHSNPNHVSQNWI